MSRTFVLGDEDRLRAPQRLHMARRPVQRLGTENMPGRLHLHLRVRRVDWDTAVARHLVGRCGGENGQSDKGGDALTRQDPVIDLKHEQRSRQH
jgi:hypothetical protein